jgi:transposase
MSRDNLSPPAGIPAEDWATTPLSVRLFVITVLERMARLEERVNQTSHNSSKPPSSDPPSAVRPRRQPSGRKAGGQPGHAGHGRVLKSEAEVDQVVDVRPTACGQCGALLLGEDAQPVRHQVTEIPPVKPIITEYRRHTVWCQACGGATQAAWPGDMPTSRFGSQLQATVGYLTGRVGMSQREVQEVLAVVFHTEVSLGSIAALEQAVSVALETPVTEVVQYVQRQPMRNVDETPWRERAKRVWLWVKSTPLATVFRILKTRGAVGAQALLGKEFPGVVGTDRLASYDWIAPERRQVCWAHVKRDFLAMGERSGEAGQLGLALVAEERRVFALWAEVQARSLSRADFQVRMLPIMARVKALLQVGARGRHAKTAGTCRHLLKREAALWTFVWEDEVEPTNNAAERPLRRAVLWRRRSFGTQSEAGSRFVERILTVVTTLRQQQRDVLAYLTAACLAKLRDDPAPALVPRWRPIATSV